MPACIQQQTGCCSPPFVVPLLCVFFLLQDFAAEVIKIKDLETDEYELVCIRNIDILAKW